MYRMANHNHVCGCYFMKPEVDSYQFFSRQYLQPVDSDFHTVIRSTASTTRLTQTYVNPSNEKLDVLRYVFPLYDGVSVVSFKCEIGDRVIKGVVKERDRAKQEYSKAVERGETAGLLEQLPDAADVFTTTVGNVPANSTIKITIIYIGELSHDAEVDGIRLTIPAKIVPRYGAYPGELLRSKTYSGGKVQVTVDVTLTEGSFVQKIQSPTHPISVSIGTLSKDPNAEPEARKGSATLTLGSVETMDNFILQVVARESDVPRALLEVHPSLPHQRAIMATLVPKFSLEPIRPEIIFVADRSGSMAGTISTLKSALLVLLKSLPVGVKFNICSFGTKHDFLWPQSKPYSQSSLDEAISHVGRFEANYGGTETLEAVKGALKHRFSDIPTEIMLLTDGDIWGQHVFFDFISSQVRDQTRPLRVFPLGIGSGVSTSLIEGTARAGNGFAQFVQDGEKFDKKLVRMLKAALTPHITDYTLEVNYGENTDDDFELVEKVTDLLDVDLNISEGLSTTRNTISLFDKNFDEDKSNTESTEDPYSHLPKIDPPKLLQAPYKLPSLYPFQRMTAYLMLSPDTSHLDPVSITLKGTSPQGPLALNIPVEIMDSPGATLHQLAARKASQEIEEGRGWIQDAKTSDGRLLNEVRPSIFTELVQREGERLGVKFQVAGRYCSFVALESDQSHSMQGANIVDEGASTRAADVSYSQFSQSPSFASRAYKKRSRGNPTVHQPSAPTGAAFGASGGFGASQNVAFGSAQGGSLFGSARRGMSLVGSSTSSDGSLHAQEAFKIMPRDRSVAPQSNQIQFCMGPSADVSEQLPNPESAWDDSIVHKIIKLQLFDGSWQPNVIEVFGSNSRSKGPTITSALATMITIVYLNDHAPQDKEVWELVAEKARTWLEQTHNKAEIENLEKEARVFVATI